MEGTAESRLRQKALRLLSLREHSRSELARKLDGLGTPEEVAAILDRMSELGLQSDQRYAEVWVRSKAARFGTQRMRRELAQRGVSDAIIEAALDAETPASDLDRARAVWRTKFGQPAADRREWGRQARFLQGRGFATDVIMTLLKEVPDESA